MKKLIMALALLFSLSIVFTGCREKKSTGEKIEEAVEDTADDVGDAIDDATDDN